MELGAFRLIALELLPAATGVAGHSRSLAIMRSKDFDLTSPRGSDSGEPILGRSPPVDICSLLGALRWVNVDGSAPNGQRGSADDTGLLLSLE